MGRSRYGAVGNVSVWGCEYRSIRLAALDLNEYETMSQLMHAGNNMGSAVVHTYLTCMVEGKTIQYHFIWWGFLPRTHLAL